MSAPDSIDYQPTRLAESRRVLERIARRQPIVIHPRWARFPRRSIARLTDYNSRGVGFACPLGLPAGTEFVLNLIQPDGTKIPLTYVVVRCEEAGNNRFIVGARLLTSPNTPMPITQIVPAPLPNSVTHQPGGFPSSHALGFARSHTLDGKTVIGWDRQIDLKSSGTQLWICIHSPGKQNGWGIFVDRRQFEAALLSLREGAFVINN